MSCMTCGISKMVCVNLEANLLMNCHFFVVNFLIVIVCILIV